jgi:hypothetical protein
VASHRYSALMAVARIGGLPVTVNWGFRSVAAGVRVHIMGAGRFCGARAWQDRREVLEWACGRPLLKVAVPEMAVASSQNLAIIPA